MEFENVKAAKFFTGAYEIRKGRLLLYFDIKTVSFYEYCYGIYM